MRQRLVAGSTAGIRTEMKTTRMVARLPLSFVSRQPEELFLSYQLLPGLNIATDDL